MNKIVNLKEKFTLFDQYWTPKIVGEINNFYVKVFKAKGEFVWHSHEKEDEFFLVVQGQLKIKLPDRTEVILNENEFFNVTKGMEHCPYAEEEAHILLFEKKEVVNTGQANSEKKERKPEWL